MSAGLRHGILVVLVAALLAIVGYVFVLKYHFFTPLQWNADNGALRLTYTPGKSQAWLFVDDRYTGLAPPAWVLAEPAGPYGRLRSAFVPCPEELLPTAVVMTKWSGRLGLMRFYKHGCEGLRVQIVDALKDVSRKDPRVREELEGLLGSPGMEWLDAVLSGK